MDVSGMSDAEVLIRQEIQRLEGVAQVSRRQELLARTEAESTEKRIADLTRSADLLNSPEPQSGNDGPES